MNTFYSKCKDRGKCALIGVVTLVACVGIAYGLSYVDSGNQKITVVDGVHYDDNPWTKYE